MPAVAMVCLLLFAEKGLEDSPRVTPTVRVIREIQPAVVAIFTQPQQGRLNFGSGTIIHEQGFILTNDHVVRDHPGVVCTSDGRPTPFRLVGRIPEKDIALIQIKPTNKLHPVPLGRSDDLMIGEPVLVGGNPGGRGIVFTSGIVSSPSFLMDIPHVLAMANFANDNRDRYIQFDAATNQGNSGGPLVNALGQQIGIVSRKFHESENVNFAIPIDRVRQHFSRLVAPEVRWGFHVGLEIDVLSDQAVVVNVQEGSPAASAGLRSQDILLRAGDFSLRTGIDWLLSLAFRKPGEQISIEYQRGQEKQRCLLTLGTYPMPEPVAKENQVPGLRYTVFHGSFDSVDQLAGNKAVQSGTATIVGIESLASEKADHFAVVFEGFLYFPREDVYKLSLKSDDGAKLYLAGKLLLDNDGRHPVQETSAFARLPKGLQPIRIEYFEATGDAVLQLFMESSTIERRQVSAESFYHDPIHSP